MNFRHRRNRSRVATVDYLCKYNANLNPCSFHADPTYQIPNPSNTATMHNKRVPYNCNWWGSRINPKLRLCISPVPGHVSGPRGIWRPLQARRVVGSAIENRLGGSLSALHHYSAPRFARRKSAGPAKTARGFVAIGRHGCNITLIGRRHVNPNGITLSVAIH